MDYLCAEISTSKQKKFSLVTFVDTPGLVDGDMVYPFDVNSAITWLGIGDWGGGSLAFKAQRHSNGWLLSRRWAGGPGVCVLWPNGSSPLQAHPQHRGEAEPEVRRQAVFLPQQGGRSRQRNRPTGECFSPSVHLTSGFFQVNAADNSALVELAEGDDADRSGTVSTPRAQQMWLWDADNLHPQPTKGL